MQIVSQSNTQVARSEAVIFYSRLSLRERTPRY